MKIYNTLTKTKEDFIPITQNEVKMYVCGPTVYNFLHIGNARPYVVYDTVRRYFEHLGYNVTFIQNYTDIDDKIIKRADEEGISASEVADTYIKEAETDAKELGVKPSSFNPRVTQEISEIIDMIKNLLDKGYAYEVNGSVYFDTEKFEGYGKLSHKNIEDLLAGARIEVSAEKKNPMDFILWKPAKPGEPKWASPWSDGRPGWHIECSVMAKKYLGDTIDIHAGGEDLAFPHHENEIAQSEAANGITFVNYWMHNAFINIDNQKISKSKGNFFSLREVADEFPYMVIRFFFLMAHYRSPINFTKELLVSATSALDRIQTAIFNLGFLAGKTNLSSITLEEEALLSEANSFEDEFEARMQDDFNTADAITAIFEFVKFANVHSSEKSSKPFVQTLQSRISRLCEILGIEPKRTDGSNGIDEDEIDSLIAQRQQARTDKNWAMADAIRDDLLKRDIVLEDTPQGVRWVYKGK